ncbi:hypothetical protein TVAG_425950 [Trichomonas vaginalis G3]|uniref:Initiator binding domain-containing protein n=1 Tax=Trichomonas vaginalis (strain ATCC PRA-98 / G3) TaxID=412133 RepID=A2FGY3_TRIV3|nr:transcription-initiator DNA-binding domain ibd family [Trichomonas vaginalis G3]EAX95842.1 hypothetical protein TVAG_425950 [Trichomonas vaginalis G3]KAI5494461.1 transcription-initiator DNA-binding domain ibd family [Trichomonas vaginalis G3]|eukprot:XP_001308772.1 hypothetical protein [Trichomonas vaginalis G3]
MLKKDCIALSEYPKFWALLNSTDMYQYMYIRTTLLASIGKNIRNKSNENFADILQLLKNFCQRGDCEDWKRCLVAGICFFGNGSIAINTHQLRLFIGKCKSSINGSLHKLGFNYGLERSEATANIIGMIPMLKENPSELRQWTLRSPVPLNDVSSVVLSEQSDCESIKSYSSPIAEPVKSDDAKKATTNTKQPAAEENTYSLFNDIEFEINSLIDLGL